MPPSWVVPNTEILDPEKLVFRIKLLAFAAPVAPTVSVLTRFVAPKVSVPVPSKVERPLAVVRPVTEPPNVTLLLVVVSVTKSAASVVFPV